jgi:cardiolipin synthase A/B
METFTVHSNPREIYRKMLSDISSAKKYIFLETYIFDNDEIGRKFRDLLIKKAKQGVKIKLLLDAWGGTAKKPFFEKLEKAGGEVRFFREIRYLLRFFSKNHERNHRKLLIIDNKITYIGSMNITSSCLDWRELVLRINEDITCDFAKSFFQSWQKYGELDSKRLKKIVHHEFEIIQDIPSYVERATEERFYKLFSKARKNIFIETPYFIPSPKMINTMGKLVKKGIKIILLIPYRSDVMAVDVLRNSYLGRMYKKGISINYYTGVRTMHSKLLIIDDNFFMMGSSNIDYRSLVHSYEINVVGKDREIIRKLRDFFNDGMSKSIQFDYGDWKNRSSFLKTVELILGMIRNYL